MPYDVDSSPDSTGDLPAFTRHITGQQLVAQRVAVRLATHKGEWILDTSKGLDYQGWAQLRPFPADNVSAIIKAEIEGTPGVTSVEDWSFVFDKPTREVTYTGTIITTEGDIPVEVALFPQALGGNTNPSGVIITMPGILPIVAR